MGFQLSHSLGTHLYLAMTYIYMTAEKQSRLAHFLQQLIVAMLIRKNSFRKLQIAATAGRRWLDSISAGIAIRGIISAKITLSSQKIQLLKWTERKSVFILNFKEVIL